MLRTVVGSDAPNTLHTDRWPHMGRRLSWHLEAGFEICMGKGVFGTGCFSGPQCLPVLVASNSVPYCPEPESLPRSPPFFPRMAGRLIVLGHLTS